MARAGFIAQRGAKHRGGENPAGFPSQRRALLCKERAGSAGGSDNASAMRACVIAGAAWTGSILMRRRGEGRPRGRGALS